MERYLDLLLEQMNKNRQINELTKKTRDAIAAGNIGMVMESDAMKREIFSQLQSLQAEMDPYLAELPTQLDFLSPQLKDQILTVSKHLQGIIEETIAIDRENEVKIGGLRDAIGEKMKEIGKGKKALKGYKSPTNKKPKLFDGQI